MHLLSIASLNSRSQTILAKRQSFKRKRSRQIRRIKSQKQTSSLPLQVVSQKQTSLEALPSSHSRKKKTRMIKSRIKIQTKIKKVRRLSSSQIFQNLRSEVLELSLRNRNRLKSRKRSQRQQRKTRNNLSKLLNLQIHSSHKRLARRQMQTLQSPQKLKIYKISLKNLHCRSVQPSARSQINLQSLNPK